MTEYEAYTLLDQKCNSFFPATGEWYSCCFQKSNDINPFFFPCHTRDCEWLAYMMQSKFKLYYLPTSFIEKYIQQSVLFQKARHDYEQKIVKWQIDWMNNDGENWLVDKSLGGEFFEFSPKCDIAFRKGIVDTLTAIGMPLDAIEEGIEKNYPKWRNKYMTYAFRNIYYPISFNISSFNEEEKIDYELQRAWLRKRLYEYYQEHKDSVDKYGIVLSEMKMTEEELKKLDEYIAIKEKERLEQLKTIANEEKTLVNKDTTIEKQLKKLLSFK